VIREVEAGGNPFTGISRDDNWGEEDVTPITGKGLAIGGGIIAAVIAACFSGRRKADHQARP
jgi:hypothetical protein